ncbi:MAG: tyrosine-type recombinase/integrase [Candidatus Bathyarchaeota archaeon]|nr:tyrosine-type recombinase/integrase [Candidatus Termiticorpusculum sp.]
MVDGREKVEVESKPSVCPGSFFGNSDVVSTGDKTQHPLCPKCDDKTEKVWRAGTCTSILGDVIQRWICRRCGLRFNDRLDATVAKEHVQQELILEEKAFKSQVALYSSCQISAQEAKNLVAEQQQTNPIVLRKETFDINALAAKYEWYLQKEGRRIATIKSRVKLLKILWKRGANFDEPESVKEVITKQKTWCEGRKGNAVDAYSSYLAMEGKTWNRPIYNGIAKIPFVPKEAEIDQLIAGCNQKVATFLQLLKETRARCGEVWHCSEDDFDFETNTVTITPEKNSNPRIFKMSSKLVGMIQQLPKACGKYYFAPPETTIDDFRTTFERQRQRIAVKLNNPRLKKIMFKTLRTWGGTYDYHRTKDVLYVKKQLGHKNMNNTLVYIQLDEALFKDEVDYVSKVAKTEVEACLLIEGGFEFVCDFDGHKLFRKRASI